MGIIETKGKMIRDVLYLHGYAGSMTCPVDNVFALYLRTCGRSLSKRERRVLVELGDSKRIAANTSNMSDEYLETRLSIANKLYTRAVKAMRMNQ